MKLFKFGLFLLGWLAAGLCLLAWPALAGPSVMTPKLSEAIWHDISCPSDDFCLAVGSIVSAGSSRPVILTKRGDRWQADVSVRPLAKFDTAQLDTVSCSSADFCLAVGTFTTLNNGWKSWTASWSDGHWRLADGGFGTAAIDDVSCISQQFCLAVGSVSQTAVTNQARAFTYARGAWSRLADAKLDNIGNLAVVKCFSATDCLIAGGTASVTDGHYALARYLNGVWSIDQSFAPSGAGYFRDLACRSRRICWLLGTNLKTGGRVAASWREGVWSEIGQSVGASQYPGNVWQSIGCLTTKCFLAGRSSFPYHSSPAGRAIIDNYLSGSNWQTEFVEPADSHGDALANTPSSQLWQIDCSTNICSALGQYYHQGQPATFAATFNGSWSVDDLDELINKPKSSGQSNWLSPTPINSAWSSHSLEYVAFGDSITTGHSIASCIDDRRLSAWGCSGSPPAIPYPQRLAERLSLKLTRVGIWGYTAHEAAIARRAGQNRQGKWEPQLLAVEQANRLVTGSLGINDLHFSDVVVWLKRYFQPGDQVTVAARKVLADRAADFNQIFASLVRAKQNGSQVVVTLYYNPFDSDLPFCGDLETLGRRLTNALDTELAARAQQAGLRVADLRPGFRNHGAATAQPYVFGDQCKASSALADWLPEWAGGGGGKQQLSRHFDPHPNNAGTEAIQEAILKEVS